MQSPASNRKPRQAPPLRAEALYMTPAGRCCRWVPNQTQGPRKGPQHHTFVYVGSAAERPSPMGDAFSLSQANLWMLRLLGDAR